MAEEERRERRQLGHQPDPLDVAVLRVLDVLGVGIEGREPADGAEQHAHRVRVVAVALEELDDVGVDVGVVADVLGPLVELRLVGQLAFVQQVGHFEEGRLLGDLLDRIAAIAQDAAVAVDEGDGAAAGGGVHEGRVVGHQAEIVVLHLDLAQVEWPGWCRR